MTLDTTISLQVDAVLKDAAVGGLGTPTHAIRLAQTIRMLTGTGAGQADIAHAVQYSIAGSGTQEIDLKAITDTLGNSITFSRLKAMAFFADPANGDRIDIGPAAIEGFDFWIGEVTTAEIRLYPGNLFLLTHAVDATGWVITSNVDDKLTLTNIDAATVLIDVVIIGTDT